MLQEKIYIKKERKEKRIKDAAVPICPSDEDFVLGEIGESINQWSESESDSFKCCHLKQHLYNLEHIRNIF